MRKGPLILGIETSCDETAAAVVAQGRRVISSKVASQFETHAPYGGVVPELAGRKHLENLLPVVRASLEEAEVEPSALDAIAITSSPGLLGALLVGTTFAKAVAFGWSLPLIEINHLYAHALSVFIDGKRPRFPFLSLVASGGHSNLFVVRSPLELDLIGRTRDDAAGEVLDKISKFLGLGYPGGPVIDRLAAEGNPRAFRFPRGLELSRRQDPAGGPGQEAAYGGGYGRGGGQFPPPEENDIGREERGHSGCLPLSGVVYRQRSHDCGRGLPPPAPRHPLRLQLPALTQDESQLNEPSRRSVLELFSYIKPLRQDVA